MEEVVIVSAVRTAIGKFAGSLASLPAANLAPPSSRPHSIAPGSGRIRCTT